MTLREPSDRIVVKIKVHFCQDKIPSRIFLIREGLRRWYAIV